MPVTIKFLGGLGVIGRNCMAIRDGEDVLIVDAGLHFPELSGFGIDIALPDFRAIADESDLVKGIIITHGHEDHIGALGTLSEYVGAPVLGSRISMALASRRLKEAGAENPVQVVRDYETVQLGVFRVTFYPVAHSVPDSMALSIETSEGTIYHTGDFKLDPTPLDSRTTDLIPLARLGSEEGVELLLIDSTNAEEPGWTESELAVRPGIEEVFERHPHKRVICSCFASHIHRVAQLTTAAKQHGRKVVPVGRSMIRIFEVARQLGILEIADSDVLSLDEARHMDPSEVCILSTGSQGEPRAALSLMARGEHRQLTLTSDDVILLSSDAIPGNESDVGRLIDQLVRRGAEVVHAGMTKVHVSGHAKRDELRHVIKAANPKAVIPIHGEFRHMVSAANLVSETVPKSSVLVAEDGHEIELRAGEVRKVGEFPAPYVYRSNASRHDVSSSVVHERRALQSGGVLILTVSVEEGTVRHVDLEQFGWLNSTMFESVRSLIETEARSLAVEAVSRGVSEPDMEAHLESKIRRQAKRLGGSAPHTIVFFRSESGD